MQSSGIVIMMISLAKVLGDAAHCGCVERFTRVLSFRPVRDHLNIVTFSVALNGEGEPSNSSSHYEN